MTNPPNTPPQKAPIGLRSVAVFELVKGLLFLAIAISARWLIHGDVESAAEAVIRFLHLDPAWHYSRVFVENSVKLTDARLRLLSWIALAMAAIRMAEAYGLWHAFHWAEWFAVITAGVYLPIEVYHFCRHPSAAGAFIFLVNLLIVVYLARLLAENRRKKMTKDMGSGI